MERGNDSSVVRAGPKLMLKAVCQMPTLPYPYPEIYQLSALPLHIYREEEGNRVEMWKRGELWTIQNIGGDKSGNLDTLAHHSALFSSTLLHFSIFPLFFAPLQQIWTGS